MSTTTHLMTAEELFNLQDDSHRHELIKGELLTMSPPGYEHGAVTMNLSALLHNHVKRNSLGVVAAEMGFKLESDPDTVLAPDISFIARERVGTRSTVYRSGPPDLAVEVLSPSDSKSQSRAQNSLVDQAWGKGCLERRSSKANRGSSSRLTANESSSTKRMNSSTIPSRAFV